VRILIDFSNLNIAKLIEIKNQSCDLLKKLNKPIT
jgi:hypothetical protein